MLRKLNVFISELQRRGIEHPVLVSFEEFQRK